MVFVRFNNSKKIFIALLSSMILLSVSSCANTQVGEQLAKSFDPPLDSDDENTLPTKLSKNTLQKRQSLSVGASSQKKQGKQIIRQDNLEQTVTRKNSVLKEKEIPFTPQPYRITIKLSGANPSAPAESVTRALRKAGVRFEVEKIERVNSQAGRESLPVRTQRRR